MTGTIISISFKLVSPKLNKRGSKIVYMYWYNVQQCSSSNTQLLVKSIWELDVYVLVYERTGSWLLAHRQALLRLSVATRVYT